MENTVSSIATSFSGDALWGVVGNIMPVVIPVTLFAFGFLLVRRVLKAKKFTKGGM